MSEKEEAQSPETVTFRMTVTIPNEDGVYSSTHVVNRDDIALIHPEVDLPDEIISRMFKSLQKKRRELMWGICEEEGCEQPNAKNKKKCFPHIWTEERMAKGETQV
jgi:hypothetical protein